MSRRFDSCDHDRYRDRRSSSEHRRKSSRNEEADAAERKRQRKLDKHESNTGSVFGYTNESNPFGDSSLSNVFIWNKKHKKELASGGKVSLSKVEKKLKRRQLELRDEIGRIKNRKEEREIEKEQMEELKIAMSREMEKEMNADWDQKEEEFHREQARIRVMKRIKERRQTPCDMLASNLFTINYDARKAQSRGHSDYIEDGNDLAFDLIDPCALFKGLDKQQLQKLAADIDGHIALEENLDYWEALAVVCQEELMSSSSSMIDPVKQDLESMFDKKSSSDLRQLKATAYAKVSGIDEHDDIAVDVDYWQSLLPLMDVAIARAFLREYHNNLLRLRVAQLSRDNTHAISSSRRNVTEMDGSMKRPLDSNLSPVSFWSEAAQQLAITSADDLEALASARRDVLMQQFEMVSKDTGAAADAMAEEAQNVNMELLANGKMAEDEQAFSDIVQLPDQEMIWSDKYKPRKPRFFNCVKTGFEWSKYNQTHYDRDNPPPKIVQGYKFNLFYPDLLDPSIPPTFRKEKIPDDPNFCILRFTAGPPYQDIAFKIVNKPWESSQRHGYRCKFERGILHLYFNFRRIRYRR